MAPEREIVPTKRGQLVSDEESIYEMSIPYLFNGRTDGRKDERSRETMVM